MVFDLWSSLNCTLIKYKCPIKKSNKITLTYLSLEAMSLELQGNEIVICKLEVANYVPFPRHLDM